VLVALLGLATLRAVRAAADRDAQVDRALEVTRVLADLRARVTDAQAAERGYVLTGADRYLAPYHGAATDVARDLAGIRALLAEDRPEAPRLDTLSRQVGAEFNAVARALAATPRSALGRALSAMDGEDAMAAMRRTAAALERDERARVADDRRRAHRQRMIALATSGAGTAAAVIMALVATGGLSLLVARRDRAVVALRARTRLLQEQATALEHVTRTLRGANDAKSELLHTMSHELRTPLTAIEGYAELMQMELHGPVTDAQREDLRRVRRAGQHLLALITNILEFARVDAGHVAVEHGDVGIDDVLRTAGAMVEPQALARGIAFRYVPCDAARTARGDGDKVRQILVNLLGNAVKFTNPGGSVTLSSHESGDTIRIDVADTGCGITPEAADSIFQPFVQLGPRRTGPADGVGLGLPISRALASAMGGAITVASVPGAGSTFTLSLPAARAAGDDAPRARPARRGHEARR
jgi:signal transduction histidine kinase